MSTNANLDIKQFSAGFKKLGAFLKKHAPIIFIVTVFVIYGFLIFQINRLSTAEPSQEQIAEQQNLIQRLKIDQETVDRIERLQDQNVSIQSLFKAARDNPFRDN
ncbi:hypothetical protein KY385_01185 [Candidatus Parcubacteria bacterium]|nr:hypothetical protein [Candidatus Parcubacteria bacterium]